MQRPDATKLVGQPSRQPSAYSRDQQRRGRENSGLPARDSPDRDQRRNNEAIELDVHRVQCPAARASRERTPFDFCESGEQTAMYLRNYLSLYAPRFENRSVHRSDAEAL